jgi:probable rRNA maturation factor
MCDSHTTGSDTSILELNQSLQNGLCTQVPHFQVDVWFCSDRKIGEMNGEWRQKSKPTDILSFPANDFESPGVFADDPSLEFQKHLGDLVVAPRYVMKQCNMDKEDFEV